MDCPQCHSDKISSDGACLDCGCLIQSPSPVLKPESADVEKANPVIPIAFEMSYSAGTQTPAAEDNLPQWRKELSQRLKALKDRKETAKALASRTESKTPQVSTSRSQASVVQSVPVFKPVDKPAIRKSVQKPPMPIPRQKPLEPLDKEPPVKRLATKPIDPQEIQKLIDSAVSRQSPVESGYGFIADSSGVAPERFEDHEGKLILLSRTLSGLIDLICVVLCTGIFIIAIDFFSGIIVLDGVSLVVFSALFLLIYFVYSLFFLAASNQTIGMMITDLRIIGIDQKRPSLRQLIHRCFGYLGALFGLGIGLLLSLFNRENLCLHDRLSGTRIVRN
jgi:uncharacterized RDD family membrane protein YckC